MKALVTGASGVLGNELCKVLQRENIAFKAAGRSKVEGAEWSFLDLKTGEGTDESLKGVDVVFHLASATKGFDRAVDVEGTKQFAEAAKKSGVKHFIFISIVGTDSVNMVYYQIKTEAEKVIRYSGINYSILRATQFHGLIDQFFSWILMLPVAFIGKGLKFQVIEPRVVAEKLFEISKAAPLNNVVNLGGKETLDMRTMAEQWLQAQNKKSWLINFPVVGSMMKQIANGNLTCEESAADSITWKEWLKNKYGA
jgi:uncharacterized protein YbjT (DUF2867 family)